MRDLPFKKIIAGVVVTVFILISFYQVWSLTSSPSPEPIVIDDSIREVDHVKGDVNAPHTLLVYSDFACPGCAGYATMMKPILDKYKDSVRMIFRHAPFQRNGFVASRVAEAAHIQNAFWDMHDALYINQSEWISVNNPTDLFIKYAEELGLSQEQFSQDLESASVEARVQTDLDLARSIGISETPTLFFDGIKLTNIRSAQDFEKALVDSIAK